MNVAEAISKIFSLEFYIKTPPEGNVCFAQNEEVRDDFRTFFTLTNLLNYIHGILASAEYPKLKNELLESKFQQITIPESEQLFWDLVREGEALRIENRAKAKDQKSISISFPISGKNRVTREVFELNEELENGEPGGVLSETEIDTGKLWINEKQYFDKVPKIAWEFQLETYSPVGEWLLEHKNQELKSGEIFEFQEILVNIAETAMLRNGREA
ncbi:hypothetical protein SAMN05444483_101258 [Salegentibacter echinorum]|uniref:Type ISP restriction-modification enzyme LLaBIII C-terminal specificity domain-containing protein n=1 Tax=Salegentibacter echinorum TaxID=1073325 RepID=A0A1M5BZX5_SALEC|nr:type ISP restriction/modification enzyme [Salegentibacter echinorum]SHF47742.1 hypothetical protein SAMN05444483_101258 [Salegentibacter echinorum]